MLDRKVRMRLAGRSPSPYQVRQGRLVSTQKLDADLLTSHEIEKLVKACSGRAPSGIRNRALIAVAWRSGLRIGEVLALKPKDLDLQAGTKSPRGDHSTPRHAPRYRLPGEARSLLVSLA
jgi:integrase